MNTLNVRRKDGDTSKPLPRWARAALSTVKLGDKVHAVAKPVAIALKLNCIDPETRQLRIESPCAKRRAKWNGE